MSIKLKGSSDGSVSFDAPADTSPSGSDITLTLPTSAGSADQFLKNSGIAGELEYSSMVETSTGVGISTASPGYPLEVAGQIETSGSNNAVLFAGNSSTPTIGAGIHKPADDTLAFVTASTEQARINSSGTLLLGVQNARSINGVEHNFQLEDGTGSGSGRISIGTNNTVNATGPGIYLFRSRSGSVGGTTLVNDGDDLGSIYFQGADGNDLDSRAAQIRCEVDGTPGNNDMPGRLLFSTTADGGVTPQERMRIDKDGKLFVKNSFSDSARNTVIQIECSGQGRGKILSGNSDTDSASLGASSDRRLKTNIRNYTGGLERIRQIPVKIYDEVNTSATDVISWVADEVAPIFPEAVIGEANAVDADGNPEYQTLSSLKFFPDLVQCVQTLIAKVEALETQNTAQQAQIDDLLARVTALEAA